MTILVLFESNKIIWKKQKNSFFQHICQHFCHENPLELDELADLGEIKKTFFINLFTWLFYSL